MSSSLGSNRAAQRKQEVSTRQKAMAGRPGLHDVAGAGITIASDVAIPENVESFYVHTFSDGSLLAAIPVSSAGISGGVFRYDYEFRVVSVNPMSIGPTIGSATLGGALVRFHSMDDANVAMTFANQALSEIRYAWLTVSKTSVTAGPETLLLTRPDSQYILGFNSYMTQVNEQRLLATFERQPGFGHGGFFYTINRTGNTLSVGGVATYPAMPWSQVSGGIHGLRVSDSLVYYVYVDSEGAVSQPPFTTREVVGFPVSVGASPAVGTLLRTGRRTQTSAINPTAVGARVVVMMQHPSLLAFSYFATEFFAIAPTATGSTVGAATTIDYELTTEPQHGLAEATRTQAAGVFIGAHPSFTAPDPGYEVWGAVATVASNLDVTVRIDKLGLDELAFHNVHGQQVQRLIGGNGHVYGLNLFTPFIFTHYRVGRGDNEPTTGSMPRHRLRSKERV